MLKLFKWLWLKAQKQAALEIINQIERSMRKEQRSHINGLDLCQALSKRYLLPDEPRTSGHVDIKLDTEALRHGAGK